MAFGGLLEKVIGTKLTILLGGWLMRLVVIKYNFSQFINYIVYYSTGVLLSYFTIKSGLPLLVLTYGLCYGVGIGIAYSVAIAAAMAVRWLIPNSMILMIVVMKKAMRMMEMLMVDMIKMMINLYFP